MDYFSGHYISQNSTSCSLTTLVMVNALTPHVVYMLYRGYIASEDVPVEWRSSGSLHL